MTENEAIKILNKRYKELKSQYVQALVCIQDEEEALRVAISVLEEIQQYRAIGTVEECREARERWITKKPTRFYKKYGKHKWRRKENGEIDDFAWVFDYHNGVACEICGETVCAHCNPNYDELDDCEEKHWICPNCGEKIYCKNEYCKCGQHLDWSDAQ